MDYGRLKHYGPNSSTIGGASGGAEGNGLPSKSVIGAAHCYLMNPKDGHGQTQKDGRDGHYGQVAELVVCCALSLAQSGLTACPLSMAASSARRVGRLAVQSFSASNGPLSACTAIIIHDVVVVEGQDGRVRLGVARNPTALRSLVRARQVI